MSTKRSASDDESDDTGDSRAVKRLRTSAEPSGIITSDIETRAGLQRSICLALNHIGFDSSSPEALENFTVMVETYLASLIDTLKRKALSSRREQPTPADFEATLKVFNIPTRSLRRHLRPPIPSALLTPTSHFDPLAQDGGPAPTLPLLGEELSGRPDKDAKQYIPNSFPDFPSLHTYRYTATEDSDERNSTGPGRIREEAAKVAKQGEDALRKLVRASKVRNHKEARTVADKDPASRERYRLWDGAMKEMLKGISPTGVSGNGEAGLEDQTDYGMIVNSDSPFLRKEVARGGKRAGAGAVAIRSEG